MRPLELTIRGFQSYAGDHTFDFRDRRLLGVVGPIGSGKSSLLDSIAFGLYGKTPRAGRSVKDLINQRGASAHVELWFELEGEVWRAVRVIRRKGQSAHNLYRHASDDAESDRLEEITGERPVTARIEELLGLSFDAFNRSVFLAQNRFADFLQATASQRDAVLKGVFAFDRLDEMSEAAKATRDDLRSQLADLERLRTEVEADRQALEATGPVLAAATARLGLLDASDKQAGELEAAMEAGRRDVELARRRLSELGDIAAQLPARQESAELLGRAIAGAEMVEAAEQAAAAALADLEAARRHDVAVVKETGGAEALMQAANLLERLGDVETRIQAADIQAGEVAESVEASTQGYEAAQVRSKDIAADLEASQAKLDEANRAVAEAEAATHQARHDSMAVAIRASLSDGDTCPVCDQAVATVPAVGKAAPLEKSEKKLETARRGLKKATGAHTDAVAASASIATEVEALAAALDTATKQADSLTAGRTELEAARQTATTELGRLIPGDDAAAEIAKRRQQLAEAAGLLEVAALAEETARAALDGVRSQLGTVGGELVQLATTVATLAGQLGGDLRPNAEPAELGDSLTLLRKLWEEAQAASTREETEAQAAVKGSETAFAELKASLGLDKDESIVEARRQAATEQGKLAERVESLTARIERFQKLEAESSETVAKLATYTTLAEDLLPSRFLKFILDEERRGLGSLGSEHFERMTRGRYRFTEDGEFDVVDLTAAETQRKAESLSGGETFLASLALALALAEMVSRTGGRLDAFFLDEGFGSLDPEHLDLAMEGIEALVGGNRLVAVVSHVPELRERVEDLIELDTDPITGDTIVVRA